MGNGLLYPREGLADVLKDTFPAVPPRRARVVQRKSPDGDLTILVHHSEGNGYDLRGRVLLQEVGVRSAEHTSDLQSLMRISYAVFCFKKKIGMYNHLTTHNI